MDSWILLNTPDTVCDPSHRWCGPHTWSHQKGTGGLPMGPGGKAHTCSLLGPGHLPQRAHRAGGTCLSTSPSTSMPPKPPGTAGTFKRGTGSTAQALEHWPCKRSSEGVWASAQTSSRQRFSVCSYMQWKFTTMTFLCRFQSKLT